MDKKLFKNIIITAIIIILIAFTFWNYKVVFAILTKIFRIARPILIGFAIAFVLNKPCSFFQSKLIKIKPLKKREKAVVGISTLIVYLLAILVITGILLIIVPQISSSIADFADKSDQYIDNAKEWSMEVLDKFNRQLPENINIFDKINQTLEKIPGLIENVLKGVFGVTTDLVSFVVDLVFALGISVYFLLGKKKLISQLKMIIYALFKKENANKLISVCSHINITFSNFIVGQLIEACVLGGLCFIGMLIFKFEYALMISVFIAITSLIPILGPWIGTIPSAFMLLLIHPLKALWFIVFVIVLQQIESNIFYPKVVGHKVGLPALWVLLSILIGGGLFGLVGILLAVPTMSVIYDYTRQKVKHTLSKKQIDIN